MLLLKNNLSAPITYWIKIHTDYCGSITLINSNTLYHFNPALFPYSALSLQCITHLSASTLILMLYCLHFTTPESLSFSLSKSSVLFEYNLWGV